MRKIPKKMHCIRIGPNPAPKKWIQSWIDKHPDWEYRLWNNEDLQNKTWMNQKAINHYFTLGMYDGVADIMRYEILYKYGGAMHGADSLCLNTITELFYDGFDNYVVDTSQREGSIAKQENKNAAAPLYACVPGSKLAQKLINEIGKVDEYTNPVNTTGNRLMQKVLSETQHKYKRWPLHFFILEHFSGWKHTGNDKVYATHFWGSTRGTYNLGV